MLCVDEEATPMKREYSGWHRLLAEHFCFRQLLENQLATDRCAGFEFPEQPMPKRYYLGLRAFCGLTFELSGRRRHGALDSKRKMGRRPSA